MKNLQLTPHRQQTIDKAAFAFDPLLLALIKTKSATIQSVNPFEIELRINKVIDSWN